MLITDALRNSDPILAIIHVEVLPKLRGQLHVAISVTKCTCSGVKCLCVCVFVCVCVGGRIEVDSTSEGAQISKFQSIHRITW